jgi:glycosyltransferase involved in cell wall biosynthesis
LPYAANIVCINTSSRDTLAWPLGKNFAEARRRFFWFGGTGAVHKGLDLVLEVFNELPDLQLFIGGAVADEPDFVEAYRQELYNRANIRLAGWINVESTLFADITRNCGYVILPSCSEGQAGSVTVCMHRGLVPIVTREVGVETKDFGITLKDCQPRTISEAVVYAANQSAAALEQHSRMAYDEAKVRYTRAAFSRNFENAMRRLMGKRYFSVGHGYPHDAFPF